MSILQDWYDGNLYTMEEIKPKNRKYCALEQKIQQEQDYFSKQFSPADSDRFGKLASLIYEQSDLFAFASFAYGFKLGLLLMQEVLTEENGPAD